MIRASLDPSLVPTARPEDRHFPGLPDRFCSVKASARARPAERRVAIMDLSIGSCLLVLIAKSLGVYLVVLTGPFADFILDNPRRSKSPSIFDITRLKLTFKLIADSLVRGYPSVANC